MIKAIYTQTLEVLKKIPVTLWGISLLAGVISLAVLVLGINVPIIAIPIAAAFSAGLAAVFYKTYRGGEAETNTLFLAFKDWKTFKHVAGGMVWMYLWIILWALIPVAGPFIAIYKSLQYAFTPYILTQETNVGGREALKKSMEDTKGYKGNMFIAMFLPAIAFAVLSGILSALGLIPYVGILFIIINFIVTIAWYMVSPLFFGLVDAGFYEYGKKPAYFIPSYTSASAAPSAQNTESTVPLEKAQCPVCGSENTVDKKFCGHCGAKL